MGWIGSERELMSALAVFGCDRGEDGRFNVYGEPPFRGLDGDIVLSPRVQVSIKGQRVSAASLMRQTSYGIGVGDTVGDGLAALTFQPEQPESTATS